MSRLIRINPRDNVAVAKTEIPPGLTVEHGGRTITFDDGVEALA